MQLNVYVVSHPLVKQLCTQVRSENYDVRILRITKKQIGIFLIYETIRNWLGNQTLYIRKMESDILIYLRNPEENYILITQMKTRNLWTVELTNILPGSELKIIHLDNEVKYSEFDTRTISNAERLIIIEEYLETDYIIQLLDYLLQKKNVKIEQIRISCIACNIQILEILGNKYNNLEVYTTHIVRDKYLYI